MALAFSVIIPVYNVEAFLGDCLDSLIAQTFTNWEAVCVNDGSTDNSSSILSAYATREERIKVVTQSNRGLSAARNAGMAVAKGEYVVFLDSDDWLEPNALETIAKVLDGEDMVCFSGRRFFEATNSFNAADQLVEKTYATGMDYYNENALLHYDFPFVCVVLRAYRRGFLVENRLSFKEGIFHEDNLFTPIACYYARKVRIINVGLYDYRVRANSITTTDNNRRLMDMLTTANELAAFFISVQGIDKTVVYRTITHYYQRAFMDIPQEGKTDLRKLCDWERYRTVSRTKLRHRFNFLKNKILKH